MNDIKEVKRIKNLSFEEFSEYFKKEKEFWHSLPSKNPITNKVGSNLQVIKDILTQITTTTSDLANRISKENINEFNTEFARILDLYNSKSKYLICSTTPEALFIKSLAERNNYLVEGALHYFQKKDFKSGLPLNNYKLQGFLEMVIFKNQENLIKNYSNNLKSFLENEFEEIQAKYKEQEILYNNLIEEIKKNGEIQKHGLEEWIKSIQTGIDTKMKKINSDLEREHETYKDLLKLEEPAKHWKKYADDNKKKSNKWFWLSVGIVGVIIIILILAFTGTLFIKFVPLQNVKMDEITKLIFSFENIKGSLLLTMIISLLIYILRLTVKYSISARHLMIDANERHTLTYFYLSLKKDTTIEKEEKQIILQSLFARSDSGLFRDEHTPNFPEGISSTISKVLTK